MAEVIRYMTVADYLAFDEASEIRNEYIDGELYPMTGGTGSHSTVIAYVIGALINAVADSDCTVRSSDLRVRIDETKYVYPDASVVCGESRYEDEKEVTLLNPTVVVEVTSPSSIVNDHISKVEFYGAVPSIEGYLILDQERVFAEWYSRAESGWYLQQFSDVNDVIALEPLGCSLPLAQVYRKIAIED